MAMTAKKRLRKQIKRARNRRNDAIRRRDKPVIAKQNAILLHLTLPGA